MNIETAKARIIERKKVSELVNSLMDTKKELQKARLENWYVDEYDRLCGNVIGHPRFTDGEVVCTSRVVRLDPDTGKIITRNTEYELGNHRDLFRLGV